MKNNSKIQIILLAALILMVGVILWNQGLGKNILITENQNNETLNNNKVVTEKKILSGDKAVVTSSRSVLNDLISKNSNGIIDQCNYGSDVYFRVYPDVWLADAPHVIYDLSGKMVASGGGYPAPGYIADPLFTKINPTCTKQVYEPKSFMNENENEMIKKEKESVYIQHSFGAVASDIETINKITSNSNKPFQIKSCSPTKTESGIVYPSFYLVGNFIDTSNSVFSVFDSRGNKINTCNEENNNNDCLVKIKNISNCESVFDTRYDK
ncbi:MAG: hypothetical protein KBD48_03905 [Candidatus Pacebacteria bacterium]|nr:hypothetical protein [Candidatus Paceibacterota bacterium]MBP9716298.1 hypothetical protein [Candidatus Paceibacterota bacterium]